MKDHCIDSSGIYTQDFATSSSSSSVVAAPNNSKEISLKDSRDCWVRFFDIASSTFQYSEVSFVNALINTLVDNCQMYTTDIQNEVEIKRNIEITSIELNQKY
jgi:hypothetical protein